MKELDLESTNRLLRVIISLMLRDKQAVPLNLRQKVALLDELGLRGGEIAKIVARSNTYVSKELVGIRRLKK